MFRTPFVLVAFFLSHFLASAQCPTVDAGPDQFDCLNPANFNLQGSILGESTSFSWSPITGLSDPFSLTTDATITETTTYYLTVKSIDYSINLVTNGDFSSGDVGFTTDYNVNTAPSIPGNQLIEGEYNVGTDPQPMHINWQACGDHTTGNGNMLIVNGAEVNDQQVWCQTINVDPNTEYAFSAWLTSVDPNGPAEIQFQINGFDIGDGNLAISNTCEWVNYFEFWDSGFNTTAVICIEDVNTQEPGNDFALDDIIFSPVCVDIDSVTLTTSDLDVQIFNDSPVCENGSFTLEATGGVFYEWSGPLDFSSSSSLITLNNTISEMTGFYFVTVTDAVGCTEETFAFVDVFEIDSTEVYLNTCDTLEVGVFTDYLSNSFLCDSIVTSYISYIEPTYESIMFSSCDSSLVGTTIDYLFNQYGCDSTIETTIFFLEADSTQIIEFTCDSFQTGMVIDTFSNQMGCDSIVHVEVLLLPNDTSYQIEQTCDSLLSGLFVDVLQNEMGCDSIIETEVILIPKDTTSLIEQTCDSLLSGSFVDILQNQAGCDSIVETEVILLPKDTTYVVEQTCDSLLSGMFVDILQNQMGCDSIIETEVILLSKDTTFQIEQTCDSLLSGFFVDVLQNQMGCDSIVETEVILLSKDTTYQIAETCDSLLSGIFIDVLQNQLGCDSIVETEVILLPKDTTYHIEQTCDSLLSGFFVDVLQNQMGCDSIVQTEVILLPKDTTYQTAETCDSLLSGIFIDVLQNQLGCDSIIETEVILLSKDSTIISEYTCDSSLQGLNIDILQNQYGCDSIIFNTILLAPKDTTYIFLESCDLNEVAITFEELTNLYDCDSLIVIQTDYFSDLEIELEVSQPDCFSEGLGFINISGLGGVSPYLYSINGSSFGEQVSFQDLGTGTYEISIQDFEGCIQTDFVVINSVTTVSVELGDNLTINQGDSESLVPILNISSDSLSNIDWSSTGTVDCPTCLIQDVYPIITTTYSIEVVNTYGCFASDQLTVFVEPNRDIYSPNIISINGDGINDVFYLFSKEGTVKNIINMQIFDRWGNNLWNKNNISANDKTSGWDGIYNSKYVVSGVYVWMAEIEFNDDERIQITGDITVIR